MSVPRTVAEVIRQHVTLEVEGIDRMYLNVYKPKLQTDSGVGAFFKGSAAICNHVRIMNPSGSAPQVLFPAGDCP
jgi:hypothetical protein